MRWHRDLSRYAHKAVWGARVVGVGAALRGAARLATIKLRRPRSVMVKLRSGPHIEMEYPHQLVPALVVFGDLIDPEYDFLRAVARPDWVVIDIGAAIGQFTVYAALLPGTTVHAYEPSIANVATLERNLQRNGVAPHVVVHKVALGEKNGDGLFVTAPNAFVSRLDEPHPGELTETVAVRTLAHELDVLGLDHVAVIKINVAGSEPEVLAGAERFLEAGNASILVVLVGTRSITWYKKLHDLGYKAFFYHPVRRELTEVRHFDVVSITSPPWPARHLLFVHVAAIRRGILADIRCQS